MPKKKTSVTISTDVLATVQREAARQDRSVSYILEKFIEEKAAAISEKPGSYGTRGSKKRPRQNGRMA